MKQQISQDTSIELLCFNDLCRSFVVVEKKVIFKKALKVEGLSNKAIKPPEYITDRSPLFSFWQRRYTFFSNFDDGIQLDEESWYSVTPEDISTHIAQLLTPFSRVIDLCCGCGGNTLRVHSLVCSKRTKGCGN